MYYFSIQFTVLKPNSFEVRSHTITRGVVKAGSVEEAEKIVWDKLGNDYAHNLCVQPITEDFVITSEGKF